MEEGGREGGRGVREGGEREREKGTNLAYFLGVHAGQTSSKHCEILQEKTEINSGTYKTGTPLGQKVSMFRSPRIPCTGAKCINQT